MARLSEKNDERMDVLLQHWGTFKRRDYGSVAPSDPVRGPKWQEMIQIEEEQLAKGECDLVEPVDEEQEEQAFANIQRAFLILQAKYPVFATVIRRYYVDGASNVAHRNLISTARYWMWRCGAC